MLILFVTVGYPPAQTGGAEAQARLQALELVKRGHQVLILTKSESFTLKREFLEGIKVIRLPQLKIRIIGTIFHSFNLAISLIFLRKKFDLIHVHLANLNADVSVLIGKIIHKPVYIKLASGGESGEIKRFRKLSTLTRFFGLRHASRVQAISNEIFDEAMRIGVSSSRLIKISNGVKFEKIVDIAGEKKKNRSELRSSLFLSDCAFIFLYLGRIATYKGIADLLEAWRLSNFSSDVALVIAGPLALDHPYNIHTIDTRIHVLGNQTNTRKFLFGSDCFILPSHGEGMSNALLEAMASKLPIISTNVGASAEVLNFGSGGRLVPPHNPKLLSKAMLDAFEDPERSKKMANFSYKQIEKKFSIEQVSLAIIEEYHAMTKPI